MKYKATAAKPPKNAWLTLQEAADLLRVSYPTLLRCAKEGDLYGLDVVRIGTQWRIARATVERVARRE